MTDARAVLASLRPQAFGTGRPDRVSDPIVEPLWAGIRALAAVDRAGALLTDESGAPIEDQPEIVSALAAGGAQQRARPRRLPDQAGRPGRQRRLHPDGRRADARQLGRPLLLRVASQPRGRGCPGARGAPPARERSVPRTPWPTWRSTCSGSTASRSWTCRCSSAAGCSMPVLAESELVRRGTFVRPPIGGWIRSWRAQGFVGLTFRAANSRYEPGVASAEWATSPMPR